MKCMCTSIHVLKAVLYVVFVCLVCVLYNVCLSPDSVLCICTYVVKIKPLHKATQGLIQTYVLEGAKSIIVETWGGGGHICHGQERDVAVYYVDDIQNHLTWCHMLGILGGHLPPCAPPWIKPCHYLSY